MGSSSSFMGASYGWFVCPRLHRAVVQEPRHSPDATLTRANTPGEHGERPVGDMPGRAEAAEGSRQPLLELRQILQHCLTRAGGQLILSHGLVLGCWRALLGGGRRAWGLQLSRIGENDHGSGLGCQRD
jgi:hypothetical protein